MITTDDEGLARRLRMLRSHGSERRYYHDMVGYNYRMSDLHAAIGLAQLARLDAITTARRANAAYLNAHIRHPGLVTPAAACALGGSYAAGHAWHQYTVRAAGLDRDEAVRRLNDAGVGTGVFYPVPAHKQKHLVALGYGDAALPEAERAAREVFSLPVHPALSPAHLDRIAHEVNRL